MGITAVKKVVKVANPGRKNAKSARIEAEASPTVTAKKKKLSSTFASKKLDKAFVEYCQMVSHEWALESLDVRAKRVANTEIEYIANENFRNDESEAAILGTVLLGTGLTEEPKSKSVKLSDLPTHLVRLCETRLLTPEEEKILFQRMNYLRFRADSLRQSIVIPTATEWQLIQIEGLMKAADWYRDLIVKSNMRLVISIVKKFVNTSNVFDDLLSDGIMALLRAVDKFDFQLGFRFSTYATQVVRRNAYRNVMLKQKEKLKVTASIQESGIDVSDDRSESSMSINRWNDLRSRLGVMLDHLDRREKLIVRARFSLGGHRNVQTLQRLADKLGVSKERIRQLEKRALEKLRGMAINTPLPEIDS